MLNGIDTQFSHNLGHQLCNGHCIFDDMVYNGTFDMSLVFSWYTLSPIDLCVHV